MTREQTASLIAAYEAEERREGGLHMADVKACAKRVATLCGLSYEDAREALSRHWAGNMGRG